MALRIFAIAIVLFLAEIVFLTTKDFKDNESLRDDIDFTDIAFENIDGYLITKNGIEAKIKASKVLKYSNKSEIFDIKTDFLHKNIKNQITAQKATLKEDIMELNGNVHYENNNSMQLNTQNLVYNTKTEIVTANSPFTLTSDRGNAKGDSFIYDQKNGIIKAQKIKYTSLERAL